VGDDVVELACDPRTLLRHRDPRGRVPLPFGLGRAQLRRLGLLGPLPHDKARVILAAIVPGIEKWLPTGAAIGLTNAPGPGPAHSLPAVVAGAVLAGYAIVRLLAASRTTIRRDVA
jgi:hypothetical protein